jgi:DNA-binding CsgD family transcriptional regulator
MRTSAERLQRVGSDLQELIGRDLTANEFLAAAGDRLRSTIGFDQFCVRICDPETSMPIAAVGDTDCETAPITYRHEYSGRDFATLPGMREEGTQVAVLSEVTAGRLERSGRWREVLEPMGVPYELTGLATRNGRVWGHVMLYRKGPSRDFDGQAAAALGRALGPLAEGIRRGFLGPDGPAATRGASPEETPAVVVLDGENRICESTPLPSEWATAMAVPGRFVSPLALQVVAIAARADPTHSALTRLRRPNGGWLSVHATAMGSPDPERVAIVIQPARTADVAQLMFASLSLTRGEQTVVEQVLQGRSTKEIAAHLYLSPHTVQDRMKSIFTKLGVRSRREVVALVDQRLA